ncbi:MAG: S-adenosylmethionine-dependent methyltransferase [Icmadophila ericetorum]|nr:S-adenosylmethionine-dependent methyltransferase [Icmadophila ericetorum]
MLPTPSTSHIDPNHIYEPAEDSFLLLDTLSSNSEIDFLKARFPSALPSPSTPTPLILEVGTGSGVVLAFVTAHAQTLFGRQDIFTLGVDVNNFACQATTETIQKACKDQTTNKALGHSDILRADLTTAFRPGTIDVLVFNPPYVPTPDLPSIPIPIPISSTIHNENAYSDSDSDFQTSSHLLSLSYAGGKDGMQVTDRLLAQLPEILKQDRGVAYILLCQQNRPEEVMRRIRREWAGQWMVEIVGRSGKVGGWEKLVVLRIWRSY